ncbi:MAG: beta-ribofuranosylaminobenzene 5'-phosphate synthase family protein [Methylotenera sp.]
MITVIPSKVTVKSTARLHMGFFDLHGGLGRKFGGIGLSLTAPAIELTAIANQHPSESEKALVTGISTVPATAIMRASAIAEQLIKKLQLTGGVSLNFHQYIPEHAGLGSGTQLALVIGSAINKLYNLNLNTAQIAELSGRGVRSGIGIAAFDYGGLLIDGGRASNTVSGKILSKVPPLLARYDFPEHWRILLILDTSQPGIHGEHELEAFNQLPVFSENLAAHLCRHVLMQAMPALVEQDLTAFGNSIQELQAHVGDYFAPAQGGRYASRQVGRVLEHLEHIGVACFGQSSWGPTGFAMFENEPDAMGALNTLQQQFGAFNNISYQIVRGKNSGATIQMS